MDDKPKKTTQKKVTLCPICEMAVDKNTAVQLENVKTKYYHEDCLEKHKNSGDLASDLKNFTDYIRDKCIEPLGLSKATHTALFTNVASMMDVIHKKHNLTYKGMHLTLKYILEILEVEFTKTIMGLIPFHYMDAKEHWEEVFKQEKQAENIDIDYYYTLEKTAYSSQQIYKPVNNLSPVDINEIDIGEDDIDDIW